MVLLGAGEGLQEDGQALVDIWGDFESSDPLRDLPPPPPAKSSSQLDTDDGTVTRPHLRRQTTASSFIPLGDQNAPKTASFSVAAASSTLQDVHSTARGKFEGSVSNGNEQALGFPPSDTREVIVHDVIPGDSLASVALSYGVKIAAVRKANKLWTSDSIHLRKVLYIPVEWSRSNDPSSATKQPSASGVYRATPQDATRSPRPLAQRRELVPVSELSFFPTRPSLSHYNKPSPYSFAPSDSTMSLPEPAKSNSMGAGVFEAITRLSMDSLSGASGSAPSRSSMSASDDVEMEIVSDSWRDSPTSARTIALEQSPSARTLRERSRRKSIVDLEDDPTTTEDVPLPSFQSFRRRTASVSHSNSEDRSR